MSKVKTTRASKIRVKDNKNLIKTEALLKVFYIADNLVQDETNQLRFERFYHPGKCAITYFITHNNVNVMEILEFNEPRRSWFINNDVCSNGRIYLTTPIDATFLALHHLRKHCTQKALALDCIVDRQDVSTARLLTTYVRADDLSCVADVKTVDDMKFYKYNAEKTLAWLFLKTQRVSLALKSAGIHVGNSAQSLNYARSDLFADDELVQENDYLRMACDYIGDYLDLDLYEELKAYLNIPVAVQAKSIEAAGIKRKSLQTLTKTENKKPKLDETKVMDDSLKDCSFEGKFVEVPSTQSTHLKECALSTKQKALAKSAKGTKSISSFFQK